MTIQNRVRMLGLAALVMLSVTSTAQAQFTSARRMAMGGVTVMRGGPGSDVQNVAYRAVPAEKNDGIRSLSLPIGLVPLLQDPPVLDTNDSAFNAFRLANLALHLPWNLAVVEPAEPQSDIGLSVSRTSLTVDLGSLQDIVPDDRVRYANTLRGPAIVMGLSRNLFVGVSPFVSATNDFELNDSLHAALAEAHPFQPNTRYEFNDRGTGVAALQAVAGVAFPIARADEGRNGLYVGARARLLKGMAFADVKASAGFTTPAILFGSDPLDLQFEGDMRTAMPSDGGWGHGFDAGAVFVTGPLELGVAANDLQTSIPWKTKRTVTSKDPVTGEYTTVTLAEGEDYTSELPATYLVTATTRVGNLLLAADAQQDALEQVTGHVGAEFWIGNLALRGGGWRDPRGNLQVSTGVGLRLGGIGIDAALATNQSNLTRERAVDLGVGLSWYPRRKS